MLGRLPAFGAADALSMKTAVSVSQSITRVPRPPERLRARERVLMIAAAYSPQRLANDLGVLSRDTDQRLCGTGGRPATLFPLLERTLGDAQGGGELALRQSGALAGLHDLVGGDFRHAGELAGLHLADRLEELATEFLGASGGCCSSTGRHVRVPAEYA
jgi:hypothetical protein